MAFTSFYERVLLSGSLTRTFCRTRSSGSVEFPVFLAFFFHLHRNQQRPQRQQDRRAANPTGRRRTTQEAQVRSFPNIISRLQEQSLQFARAGYLLSRGRSRFFGKEITSLLLFYCLSLLCRVFYLVCVCVIWNSNLFFDNIICKSDAGNLRVAF
jgi:hypothetical protein